MSIIRRLHAPLRIPEDVTPHLGASHHWKEGRSAKCLVDQWWAANDLPAGIRALLDQAPEWRDADLIDAFVERCTNLNDRRPSNSQSDLLALLGIGDRLGVLTIEAKVDEGFDRTIDEWQRDGSSGKAVRLAGLCATLGVDPGAIGHLRYQLLHRTASALIEAKRYRARQAAMIVQSWSPVNDGFGDFAAFAGVIGLNIASVGTMSARIDLAGVSIRLGWSSENG